MNKVTVVTCYPVVGLDGTIEVGIGRHNRKRRHYYQTTESRADQIAQACSNKIAEGQFLTATLFHDGWVVYFKTGGAQ